MPPSVSTDKPWACFHVVIEKNHGVVPCFIYSSSPRCPFASILLKYDANSRLYSSPFTQKLKRAVGAAVDDDDDLSGTRIF
jgi:hypothetical protein